MREGKKIITPTWPKKLLDLFLRPDLAEEVEGDLEESFHYHLQHRSKWKARLNYWYEVFHYLRPFAIRKLKATTNYNIMYANYFKTAVRNSWKNKAYTILNVSGLSVGITITILISLWLWDEITFDKGNHEHYSTIAMVVQNVNNNGEVQTWFNTPWPLADAIRSGYGDDFDYVVLSTGASSVLTYEDKKLSREGYFFEPQMPHLFTLKMVAGNRDALKEQNSVIVSESVAKALFGETDPLNKMIRIDENMDVAVTGVYQDFPENSSFAGTNFIAPWDLLLNKTEWIKNMSDPWRPNAFRLFVKIKEGASFENISGKIKDEKLKHLNEHLAKKKPELFLWPMSDWHLRSEFENGKNIGGAIQYVWLFGIVGLAVLSLACINFMNLCTARSERRAKEIGIRKSIGSVRSQLIHQFLSESFLLVLVSFCFALVLSQLLLPSFNEIARKVLVFPWQNIYFWLVLVAVCFIISLLAGSYPAFYLSSFRAVSVLKGTFRSGGGATQFRRALVILQFSISIAMIIGTIMVFRQIEFARNRPMGYQSNGVISLPLLNNSIQKQFEAFENELLNTGVAVSLAKSSAPPTSTYSSTSQISWEGKDPNLSVDFPFFEISDNFGKTINWQVVQGRDFSKEFLSDSSAMILNEASVKFMGLSDPIGTTIEWGGSPFHVVGVVSDLILRSPYEPVGPVMFFHSNDPNSGSVILVKLNENKSSQEALAKVEEVYKKFNPAQPFEFEFIDQVYARKFGNEERVGKLALIFTTLAIFISCLGIFGLAAFVAEQRTKEVGIRKVLGASMMNVWQLLSREFVMLVTVSGLIAIPIGYFVLQSWLSGFSYRTEISWWVFAFSIGGALTITLLTVSTQAIKAASANPTKSLRSE